jgi:hypothetical protein
VYSDREYVSDKNVAVMFHNFVTNMNRDVHKVCCSVYKKGRGISIFRNSFMV